MASLFSLGFNGFALLLGCWCLVVFVVEIRQRLHERNRLGRLNDNSRPSLVTKILETCEAIMPTLWVAWGQSIVERSTSGELALRRLCAVLAVSVAAVSIATFPLELMVFGLLGAYLIASVPARSWKRNEQLRRTSEIRHDVPLIVELIRMHAGAGLEAQRSLERSLDTLEEMHSAREVAHELRRACWMSSSGYTWEAGFERVNERIGDVVLKRALDVLTRGIRLGGDVQEQLRSMEIASERELEKALRAEHSQRLFHASLVVGLIVVAAACVLSASYFAVG